MLLNQPPTRCLLCCPPVHFQGFIGPVHGLPSSLSPELFPAVENAAENLLARLICETLQLLLWLPGCWGRLLCIFQLMIVSARKAFASAVRLKNIFLFAKVRCWIAAAPNFPYTPIGVKDERFHIKYRSRGCYKGPCDDIGCFFLDCFKFSCILLPVVSIWIHWGILG